MKRKLIEHFTGDNGEDMYIYQDSKGELYGEVYEAPDDEYDPNDTGEYYTESSRAYSDKDY